MKALFSDRLRKNGGDRNDKLVGYESVTAKQSPFDELM
jgi:hypothetical protein